MMKILFRIITVMIIFLVSCGFVVAQTQGADADSSQQMLQQVKDLQQRASMIAQDPQQMFGSVPGQNTQPKENGSGGNAQPQTTTPTQSTQVAKANAGNNSTAIAGGGHSHASSFNYPFDKNQLPKTALQKGMEQSSFSQSAQKLLPMSPEEIHHLKQLYSSSQYAAAAPAGVPPRPVATSLFVNLSPGATPPVIRLSEGFISSVVFLDSTGAPWPIEAYDLGNPAAFNIVWDKKNNVLMIQAKSLYTYGNLAVQLRGLNTPVMLTLVPGQERVDYRVDVTIPGYGPQAKELPINSVLSSQATPILLNVLNGVPPAGSKQLTVSGGVGKAWLFNGKMYLRTRYTLLSPGWLTTMSSADGTNAYELQKTPLLLVAENGKVEHIKVGGF